MKKIFLAVLFLSFVLPVYSAEVEVPKAESVKYFSQPQSQDARFRYDLPSGKNFFKKDNKANVNDDDEITLDEEDVKPVKKVIKKLGDTQPQTEQKMDPQDVPMNYDSFPKYYDANDMMQQQFMPMPTSTF